MGPIKNGMKNVTEQVCTLLSQNQCSFVQLIQINNLDVESTKSVGKLFLDDSHAGEHGDGHCLGVSHQPHLGAGQEVP